MNVIPLLAAAAMLAAMAPPRDQSPAPRDLLSAAGLGNSDEELARAVAAAAAHPLGSLENPVRVGGPDGERAYLARLRCSDGSAPQVGPRQPGGIAAFGSVASLYALDCGTRPPGRREILLDRYHAEHAEDRAPPGFAIEARR